MKTRILIMLAIGLLGFSGIAFAVPELDPEHAFSFSEFVFVGKVKSVEILSEPVIFRSEKSSSEKSGIAKYEIEVIEYLKNSGPESFTVSGYFLREPHGMAYETYPYEINDVVKFYLQPNVHTEEEDLIIRTGDTKLLFNCDESVTNQIPVHQKYHCWPEPMGHPLRDINPSDVYDPIRLEFIEEQCHKHGPQEHFGQLRYANDTHKINLQTCEWDTRFNSGISLDRTVYSRPFQGTDSRADWEIALNDINNWMREQLSLVFGHLQNFVVVVQFAHAGCAAAIIPQPCFDSFSASHESFTENAIMKDFGRYLDSNYDDWKVSDRNWDHKDKTLVLPAILCTEFIADGSKHYRMANWIDEKRISSWESHYNPFMCDKWLPPIDDGIKISWSQEIYQAERSGIVTVIDQSMNKNPNEDEFFQIIVQSDVDRTGISIIVYETDFNSGIFEGEVGFSPTEKSSGMLLLLEDAVYAKHEGNTARSKIILVENPFTTQPTLDNSEIQSYIDGCDPLLHKKTLPDVTIETETRWYDLQYCMWRPHYPDVSNIDNCVDLFNILYDFHTAPKPDCGLQRYNEDGTPRGVCEPAEFLASMFGDTNLTSSVCSTNYSEWAYKTKANDDVFYVFEKMEIFQDRQLKRVLDRCEENNPNRSVTYFENYTHSITSASCEWVVKEIPKKYNLFLLVLMKTQY